jgi:hypothetical protein
VNRHVPLAAGRAALIVSWLLLGHVGWLLLARDLVVVALALLLASALRDAGSDRLNAG